MNPLIHGEVFVSDDGGETDMDLGTYERFLDQNLTREHNITTGQIYNSVIEGERAGKYLGKCVQIIPHITDEIKHRIQLLAQKTKVDILLIELGGTVGDIEGLPFLEAFRQMRLEIGVDNTLFIHTTLVPVVDPVGEQKTKPTQHSVKELQGLGIRPDLIVGRSEQPLNEDIAAKIAFFADIPPENVISAPDAKSIYHVPVLFQEQNVPELVTTRLKLKRREPDMAQWKNFAKRVSDGKREVEIALIGKYTDLKDSYISHEETLRYAGALEGVRIRIRWLEAPDLEDADSTKALDGVSGVLVPGGFGSRGAEGKIMAARWARENKVPYLGVCFGFQLAVVEFARNALGMEGANSVELDPDSPHPVVDLLPEQREVIEKGATMRLGDHDIALDTGAAYELYGRDSIQERHRHRFEVNPDYIAQLEAAGLRFTGRDTSGRRMEVLELEGHPYFIASQFHPEFKSRPDAPSPLHLGLVRAALER